MNLIERLKTLEAAATPGPLEYVDGRQGYEDIIDAPSVPYICLRFNGRKANAQLIAEMRNALVPLLDRLEKLEKRNAVLEMTAAVARLVDKENTGRFAYDKELRLALAALEGSSEQD